MAVVLFYCRFYSIAVAVAAAADVGFVVVFVAAVIPYDIIAAVVAVAAVL